MLENASKFTAPFEKCRMNDTPLVGGKNANLGEMISAGINVPPGFSITTKAYDHFFIATDLNREIRPLLDQLTDLRERRRCEEISNRIHSMIQSRQLPVEIEEEVKRAYRDLSQRFGMSAILVAVRSSGTAEDLAEASLAGQHDTFLFVKDPDELIEKVTKCWASAFTTRAILYRLKMKIPHARSLMSVGVQKMISAFSAGVAFTLDPVTGDNSIVAIDASFGVGESVVRGEVLPDHYMVDKIDGVIVEKTIGDKEIKYIYDENTREAVWVKTRQEERGRPALNDNEIRELALTARKIEDHYGRAMDIEWAIEKKAQSDKGTLFILQARPETVWNIRKKEKAPKEEREFTEAFMDTLFKGGDKE
ncbi:MAG: PEP/pyruvate-binding domain-containing protein [Deltaproteobacteria bacterium]|nr:PEP/pyruvate-binding domain-containing protein [Deltaproteobacteria bacterium]